MTGLSDRTDVSFAALRALAEHASRGGGAVARGRFRSRLDICYKADGSEVTAADEAAQQAVIDCIRAVRPADEFIGEEGGVRVRESGASGSAPSGGEYATLTWVIDPIDGTRNYVRGVPLYACSVGVMRDGMPIAGAIYDPEREEMYSASRGEGLFVNGRQFEPLGDAARTRKPVVAVPSSSDGAAAAIVSDWVGRTVIRSLGTAALHLVGVAIGAFDAALANDCRLWDLAAGQVLVSEAGGAMQTLDGRPLFPINTASYRGEPLPSVALRRPELAATLMPRSR